jgi:phospholipid/cholesterol/gamma-HCH transport system substrate-binding protein
MSEHSNRRAVIVGIFVLVGLLFLVAGILIIGNLRNTFSRKLHVNAIFDDVNGLQKGNNIWFSGVKIGTIKTVRFLGKSNVKVVLNIDQASREYIRKDAKVKISTDGLIGNKILVITGGSYRAEAVSEGDTLQVEKTLSAEEMMGVLQENNRNLLDITGDVKKISGRIRSGQGNLGRLLNEDDIYNDLATAAASLKNSSARAGKALSDITEFTSRLNRKGSLAYELGNDTAVFRSLKSTVEKLDRTSDTVSVLAANLKEATANRKTPVGVLLHDEEAGANLKNTLKNLEGGSKKLEEDLEGLQHSFLLRKYFKKKNKGEK